MYIFGIIERKLVLFDFKCVEMQEILFNNIVLFVVFEFL